MQAKEHFIVQGFRSGKRTEPKIFDCIQLAKEHAMRLCDWMDGSILWRKPGEQASGQALALEDSKA